MSKLLIIFTILLSTQLLWAQSLESKKTDSGTHFGGRISRMNPVAGLVRIRTDFANIKFLNRKDRVDFWNENYPDQRCLTYVEARTNDYLLLRANSFDACLRRIHFTTGSYLHFSSKDLDQTVGVAKELVEILLKKRLAMTAKKNRHQKDLDAHVEKVDTVNKRYEILRQKLEIEWQKELASIEEDKATTFTEFKNSEARLNEIDTKLEAYRINDNNLKLDRWSLDPSLYYRK